LILEKGGQPRIVGWQEVAEEVHLPPWGTHAELAARDDADAELAANLRGLLHACERVVVNEAKGLDAGACRVTNDDGWRQFPVRRRRVDVQIDQGFAASP